MIDRPEIPDDELAAFCREHFIRKLSLFGSFLKGEGHADSDVDFLVEFHPDHLPTLIELAAMERRLSRMVKRPVDLRTAADLSRYFRDQVLDEAEVRYAE
ncbi:MAG: nucleotidyltransferase domain-containing protein [Pseudomonadota bacterium]